MTASDFVSEIRIAVGETDEVFTDVQLLRYVNRAYLQLCTKYWMLPELDTSETITTSASTAEYELSSTDVLRVIEVKDTTNGQRLRPATRYQYDNWTQTSTVTTGAPVYWIPTGVGSNNRLQLTLWPTPAGTYSVVVRYAKKPAELVTTPSATSAIIGEGWDEVLVNYAKAFALRDVGDFQKAQVYTQQALGVEGAIRDTYFYGQEDPIRVGSIAGWHGR